MTIYRKALIIIATLISGAHRILGRDRQKETKRRNVVMDFEFHYSTEQEEFRK